VASSTLYTTIDDYARFVTAILASSERQRAHEYAVSLMLNTTVDVDKSLALSWGLGWGLEKLGDDTFFFHWGANPGFQSFVMASRKSGAGVIFFTNSSNGLEAAREIVQTTLGGDHPIFKWKMLHPDE
jgi:CubicO group peptidase (beta-lactamase class C family)